MYFPKFFQVWQHFTKKLNQTIQRILIIEILGKLTLDKPYLPIKAKRIISAERPEGFNLINVKIYTI